jgi:hypothetical protein
VGRFIQADTIVPSPGNPQHFNRYSYVLNNPLKFTDPSGHQCTIEYDPFTGSYGGKSCFGDQTGMGQTLAVDWEHGGSGGCRTAAECKAAEDRLVKLLWFLGTVSFLGPAAAEAGLIGAGGTVAAQELADGDDDEVRVLEQAGQVAQDILSKIKATQPVRAGTEIPKSFTISTGETSFWVHPNATKHMAELVHSSTGAIAPSMSSQLILESFDDAVQIAVQQGIVYDEMIQIGNWELIFGAPQEVGLLPVIYHALYIPGS